MGVFVDLRDRATRQDIVELVEEHRLPEPLQLLSRVRGTAPGGERREGFGFLQPVLGLAVELLDLRLGCEGAPVQLQVEFSDPPGQRVLWERGEEGVHTGHPQAGHRGKVSKPGEVFEHFLARATAAVTPAKGEQALVVVALAPEVAPGPEHVARDDVAVVVGPGVLEGVGDDAGAVYTLPDEQVVREVVGLVPVEFVGKEPGHPRAAQELRDAWRVAEGIGKPGYGRPADEPVLEVALAVEELAGEGLARGDLAVRLDPRAPDRLPPALSDLLFYPREQGGVVLDPTIKLGRGLVEDEVLVAVHQAEDARERAPSLPPRLRGGPEPREVQVRVAREREPPN